MAENLLVKFESIEPFTIRLSDFLSKRGIAVGDVTDVVFSAKNRALDEDVDAVVTKTLNNGILFDVDENGDDILAVTLDYADYGPGKLEIGGDYLIGVGFKTTTHTKWLEGKWRGGTAKMRVVQDFFRE